VLVVATWYLAAQGEIPEWANYGILGLFVAGMLATKQVVAGWVYQDLRRENEELKGEVRRVTDLLFEMGAKAIPALNASTEAVTAYNAELRRRGNS
jgi:hypothetical protein